VSRPRFEIVTPAGNADARRLVSADTFRLLTGLAASTASDELIEMMIDSVLDQCAVYCKLARAGASPPTFAQETVRATWPDASYNLEWPRRWFCDESRAMLLLPWRTPITEIEITEGGVELVQDVDYQLLGAGVVQRIGGGFPTAWTAGGIVAEYTAGWVNEDAAEGEKMPASLVVDVVNQARLANDNRARDMTLRSEDIPGVWSGTYAVAGGDSIASSGLFRSLESALEYYRAPPTV